MKLSLGTYVRDYSVAGGAVSYDADALAFFTAASITDTTQKNAVNQLVLDLKAANIWTKMKAIYPVVGGVASSHAVNLKTPGTYNLSFATGWTHSSTGMTPLNTYANTNLIPSTALILYNNHISFYSRTNTNAGLSDIGSYWISDPSFTNTYNIYQNNGRSSDNKSVGVISANDTNSANFIQDKPASFILTSRVSNNSLKIFQNGILKNTNTLINTAQYSGLPQIPIYISALNYFDGTSNSTINFSNKQCAFASIGNGLTDAEASSFYNAVQTYQTTLGRQV